MCKFCNTEPGDAKRIGGYDVKNMVGDKVLGEETFSVDLYVNDNEVPEYYIVAEYCINHRVDKYNVEIPIKYCPFCGRKLHND